MYSVNCVWCELGCAFPSAPYQVDEEGTPGSAPEAGGSEGPSAAQKRKAGQLSGGGKRFCTDV